MVFVADDLGAWLTGLLADAGRRKLTTVVLGTDQERALRRPPRPQSNSPPRSCAQAMMSGPPSWRWWSARSSASRCPGAPLAGQATVLEGLQTGIAGQLAVLDDASLTGTDRSSADVLGVTGRVLAAKLTGHLVREIVVRGSAAGRCFRWPPAER